MTDKADKTDSADEGGAPRIFVCYSHRDESAVLPEVQWLREQGLDVWYDDGISAGTVWRQEIADAIDRAEVVLFFVSSGSIESEHCRREIHYALDRNKRVLPVYLEEVELPGDLQLGLSYIQALYISGNQYRERLIGAIRGGAVTAAESSRPRKRARRRHFRGLVIAAVGIIVVTAGWWGYREYRTPNNDLESMQDLETNVLSELHIGITLPQDLSGSDIGSAWARVVADDLTEGLLETTNFKVSTLYGAGAPLPENFSGQYLIRGRITGESDNLEASLELVSWPENQTIEVERSDLPKISSTPSTFPRARYFSNFVAERIQFNELQARANFFTDPRARALWLKVIEESGADAKGGGPAQRLPVTERLALLHKAAEYDPEAPAIYAALATNYADALPESADRRKISQLANENAQRALELATARFEGAQAYAHFSAGYVKSIVDRDFEAALRHFELAESKGWSADLIRFHRGNVNLKMGNFDQAISDFKAAKSLGGGRQEPWATYELIRAQNYSGRYEEALESLNHLQGSITQDALPASVPWLRILSYSGLGQVEEARKIWDRVIGYFPDLDDGYLAGWLPLIGEAEEGRRLLDALEQRWQTGMDCSQIDCRFPYAGSYHLGDLDQTFVWLHRVLDTNDLRIIERVYAVEFESLRADPRFEEIRRRIDAATIHFPEADRNSSLEGS